jgi:tetratricopeptide (TPR) repeat protein
MYQRALILEPDHFSHVIESTRVFRHTQKSIIALAEWQSANSDLFINCSSVEYCEQVVLAYLTIGAVDAANILLTNMGSKPRHFLDYLDLINFGQKGEEQKALSIKERLALDKPNSRIVLLHLAVAQFRAAKFSLAKSSLLQLYPNWRNKADIGLTDITADNYSALVLYAAILSKLEEKEAAALLLRKVQAFLKEDRVFDKITAEFTLAEINAQLGHTEQALLHLSKALDMGWLASLNREWWLLQNNHLLRPLSEEPSFKLLLKQHKVKRKELRDKVTDTLSVIPS